MLRRKIKQGKGRGELGKKYFTKKLAFERGRGVGEGWIGRLGLADVNYYI